MKILAMADSRNIVPKARENEPYSDNLRTPYRGVVNARKSARETLFMPPTKEGGNGDCERSKMKYFLLTLRHKWFVLAAGIKTGAPIWRLIIHDWTKLLPWHCAAYNRQFFGDANRPLEFIRCWLHHQNAHPHHWEYWIPRTGHNRCSPPYPDMKPIPMPQWAIREMVADWLGASRAYEGKWPRPCDWRWLEVNFHQIMKMLHPASRVELQAILGELGFYP